VYRDSIRCPKQFGIEMIEYVHFQEHCILAPQSNSRTVSPFQVDPNRSLQLEPISTRVKNHFQRTNLQLWMKFLKEEVATRVSFKFDQVSRAFQKS